MGRKTNFFADELDHLALLRFAEASGFRAIPQIIASDTIPQAVAPTEYTPDQEEAFFYLLPGRLAPVEAFYGELLFDRTNSKLLSHTSTVIELNPCRIDRGRVDPGRIYFDQDSTDPRFPDALKAYNKLARYIRAWPKAAFGAFRIGPHLAERIQTGVASLEYYGRKVALLPNPQ